MLFKKIKIALLLSYGFLAIGCAPEENNESSKESKIQSQDIDKKSLSEREKIKPYLIQSRQVTKSLLTELQSALKIALKSGGTDRAIEVCHSSAISLTQDVAKKNNLSVKRVSLKTRNPLNQPDSFERQSLTRFEKMKQSNQLNSESEIYELIETKDQTIFRYMKPLTIKKVCLQCHGTEKNIKPSTRTIIKKYYSEDQATEYHEGDLRGAVSVSRVLHE